MRTVIRNKKPVAIAAAAATALLAATISIAVASPASGVTPTLLVRGTYDSFNVMSQQGPNMFKAQAKSPIDLIVREHDYAPGSSTGWHGHPYPVFITVKQGQLTFYEYDDPSCSPVVVTAGHGYVDSRHGHIARNETNEPAVDISVIMAPVGGAFRTELDAPGPYCNF